MTSLLQKIRLSCGAAGLIRQRHEQEPDISGGASSDHKAHNAQNARDGQYARHAGHSKLLALFAPFCGLMLLSAGTQAQVVATDVNSAADLGRGQVVNVDVVWSRTATATGDKITIVIPSQLGVNPPTPPAGCVYTAPNMVCDVPNGSAGASGTISFQVQGVQLGGFNLTATGTSAPAASFSGTVHSTGDIIVGKVKASPAGSPVAGASTVFTLTPQISSGDDVPAGASLTVTDNLPGTTTDYTLTNIAASGLSASCNSVSAANSSRTLTCTYNGPFTIAAFNTSSITVTGTPGNSGSFTNTVSIASANNNYFDSNINNNTASVNYTVTPGTDIQAQGSFPSAGQVVSTSQPLSIIFKNNGPLVSPAGGIVETIVPATFTIGALPGACTQTAGQSRTVGGTTYNGTLISCTAASVAVNGSSSFSIPLTMPSAPEASSFPVIVTPSSGMGDANAGNNTLLLPYQIVNPYADLRASKSKTPGGPQAPGTSVTSTLTIQNDPASTSAAAYSPAQPLRIVDYARPEEVNGGSITGVTAGWTCTVTTNVVPPAFIADTNKTTRISCVNSGTGSLAVGASVSVSFTSTIASVGSPVELTNLACTGSRALAALGLADTDGPQPPDGGRTGNDCASAGTGLIATPVVSGNAQVSIVKESSVDNATFFDAVASAPTLLGSGNTLYWRMTITTPTVAANGSQTTIPTLYLTDTLPGIVNVTSPGAPAPSFKTPAITVTTSPTTYGTCPNIAAGNNALTCTFNNVPAGTTIVVNVPVSRALAGGLLNNTATLTSPDAILSASAGGQLNDAAAVNVVPQVDVALTSKTVTPATPSVGQILQFNITAQNLGVADITGAGQFTITDTLFTGTPTLSTVAYEVVSVTPSNSAKMSCAASNLATGAISCTNTAQINRYETETITIQARIKKPSGIVSAANSVLYSGVTNTATVAIDPSYCEFRTETTTTPVSTSSACNDAAATSNNSKTATFNVKVPAIDLQQGKVRVLPAGQTSFGIGDQLRYRFSIRNAGPSRAEGVIMTDALTIPAGFHVTMAAGMPDKVNTATAGAGYTLDSKAVNCSQSGQDQPLVCQLDAVVANDYLDAGKEVNFEIALDVTGTATTPVVFGNSAHVCADETNTYESSGKCSPDPAIAGNNLAAVNDVVFPKADLEVISKTVATASPVNVAQPIEYDIKLRNNGTSSTTKMRLRDTLPTGFEWLNTGANLPVVAVDSGSAATLSGVLAVSGAVPANGTDNVCFISNGVTTLSTLAQQQEITCDITGSFPPGAANSITLKLFARAKPGLYDGSASAPYLSDRTNTATVFPGKDSTGSDIAVDIVPANDSKTAVVQVQNAQIGGRTFLDLNNNGDQDGATAAADLGLGNIAFQLSGTDKYGNTVTRSTTSSNVAAGAGSLRGDYLFSNLAPSDASGYSITQTQPSIYGNGIPQPNTARTVRNGSSTGVTASGGSYAVTNTSGTSVIGGIVLAGAANGVQFDFPEIQRPAISGFVYVDADNDGVKGGSEAGINGVTVRLIGCSAGANGTVDTAGPIGGGPVACSGDDVAVNLTTTTTTDATFGAGFYQFNLDGPGRYSVIEQTAQPQVGGVTSLPGKTTAGSVDLVTSAAGSNDGGTRGTVNAMGSTAGGNNGVLNEINATVAASQIRDIVVSTGSAISVNNNFGEILPASVSGFVYTEKGALNSNYTPAVDWAFAGVSLTLTGTDDLGQAVSLTATTQANGSYVFNNLRPGTVYQVVKTNPQASIIDEVGGAFPGKDAASVVRGARVNDDTINAIALVAGASVTQTNFAVTNGPQPVVAPSTASISGLVYVDRNRNNALDGDETTRISGVKVQLVQGANCDTGTVLRTTASLSDGSYRFDGLSIGGNYLVCETQPSAYANGNAKGTAGSNSITVGNLPASGSTDNHFGELAGSIAGSVYLDANNNGVREAAESGIAGVTVTLTGNDLLGNAVNRSAVTDANGQYRFDDLLAAGASGYAVTEQLAQPKVPGSDQLTNNGITTAGSIAGASSGTATAVAVVPSAVTAITLPAGGVSIDNNFGEIASGGPDLVVTKSTSKTIFTEGHTANYTLIARNAGTQATAGNYVVSDRLSQTAAPQKWTISSASGSGWSCVIGGDRISVSCSSTLVLLPGQSNPNAISLNVDILTGAQAASPVRNIVSITGGGEPPANQPGAGELSNPAICAATPQANACRVDTPIQLAAGLSGSVWLDGGLLKKGLDSGDKVLPSWMVDLYDMTDPANATRSFSDVIRSTPAASATTNSSGYYEFRNLEPGSVYRVVFRDPASRIVFPGVVTNNSGKTTGADYYSQVVTRDGYQVLEVRLPAPHATGEITAPEQSLPIDPNGVVYDSITRLPVPGAIVAFVPVDSCAGYSPQQHVINYESYGKDAQGNPQMTVGSDGFYKFLLSGDASAPANCKFALVVTPPTGYAPAPSTIIKPSAALITPPAPGILEVQPQKTAPTGTQSTTYYLQLQAGRQDQEIVNNHIPLDPYAGSSLAITKIGSTNVVELGDSLLYTIQVFNRGAIAVAKTTVVDSLPAGFKYISGSYRLNNVAKPDPAGGAGPVLQFAVGDLAGASSVTLTYRVRVAVGAQQGDGINRAQAISGSSKSDEARWKVRVTGGVFTDEACVVGKIFVDCNGNHIQDNEELGVPGVRMYMEDGTSLISDSEGKYSMCGISPRTHVLKVDKLTLPRGSRLTTSSNRNAGDANSLFLDIQNGELHRADFIEGSCSNTVLEQVKARRTQGEVSGPQTEKKQTPGLRFESKGRMAPQEATDSANQQPAVKPRYAAPPDGPPLPEPVKQSEHEQDVPTPLLFINQTQGGAHVGK
ncbi:SdrD B-like domain-containing protein [Undibacterium terreum]|uniref:Uncharacterized protein n=1 Tax=Undibacterium terreum TaxID=1224302 RepID=A0A916UU81_9BURK|nr:SdrD B-like domain-containing protein [Undibacterium terreum]GGC88706.1 hypothetical protein GCM10011396_39920 [Undibacterium terreum]